MDKRAANAHKLPKHTYKKYDLPFLREDTEGRMWNGGFEVTDVPDYLPGVSSKDSEIRLRDYLVNRPIPEQLVYGRTPPDVDPGSLEMEHFYRDVIDWCYDGVWVGEEYYNPFFVYWMNIFVFPIYILDSKGNATEDFEIGHPYYCTIDRYILDVMWKAELCRRDVSLMGGRGIGKSFLLNSIFDQTYRLHPQSHSIVSSYNDETVNEAWNKMQQTILAVEKKHPALKLNKIKDSAENIFSGIEIIGADGTKTQEGHLSLLEKIAYGKNPDATRGRRPNRQHIEEFAAFPPSHQKGNLGACKRSSRGSWYVGGSIKKCTVYYTGTGGTVENDQAEGIFLNPGAHEILPTYDWPEAGERGCGIFIPTHIKRAGTFETTGCPDVARAEEEVDAERFAAKDDPEALLSLKMEFPKSVKEVFLRGGSNNFDQDKLAHQRVELEFNPDIPKPERGFLQWEFAQNGAIKGVKFEKSNVGDVLILEHPVHIRKPAEFPIPVKQLYVGGVDSIDQGTGDSSYATNSNKGSELCAMIKKRVLHDNYFNETSNLYVAMYKKRSKNVIDDYENTIKLAVYYNAEINLEYTKINIVSQFRTRGYYHLLKKRPTIAMQSANPNRSTELIGTQATGQLITHMDLLIGEYIQNFFTTIYFGELLSQLQDYDPKDRTKYDAVIAMGLCEIADEDYNGVMAKPTEAKTQDLELFGYYTDPQTGRKKYGIIPAKQPKEEFQSMLEAEKFQQHGSVRWIDMSDPGNPKFHY